MLLSLQASLAGLLLKAEAPITQSPSATKPSIDIIHEATNTVPKARAGTKTSNRVHDMPTEMLEEVCNKLLMPEHFYFATSSKTLYSKCRHTLSTPLKLRRKYHAFGLRDVGCPPKKWRSLPSFFEQIHQDDAFIYMETLHVGTTMAYSCTDHSLRDDEGRDGSLQPVTQLRTRLRSLFLENGTNLADLTEAGALCYMKDPCTTIQSFQILLIASFTNLRKIVLPRVTWNFEVKQELQKLLCFVAKQKPQTLLPRLHTVQWHNTEQSCLPTLISVAVIPSVRQLLASNLKSDGKARQPKIRWPPGFSRYRMDFIELIDCFESEDWLRHHLLRYIEGPCLVKMTHASKDFKSGRSFSLALIGVGDSQQTWQMPAKTPRTKQDYITLFKNHMDHQERGMLLDFVAKESPELFFRCLPKPHIKAQVMRSMLIVTLFIRKGMYTNPHIPRSWDSQAKYWENGVKHWEQIDVPDGRNTRRT